MVASKPIRQRALVREAGLSGQAIDCVLSYLDDAGMVTMPAVAVVKRRGKITADIFVADLLTEDGTITTDAEVAVDWVVA